MVVVAVCRVFGYSQFKYLAVKTSLYFNHNIKRDANENRRNRHHHNTVISKHSTAVLYIEKFYDQHVKDLNH
jgi:hypothetical protein